MLEKRESIFKLYLNLFLLQKTISEGFKQLYVSSTEVPVCSNWENWRFRQHRCAHYFQLRRAMFSSEITFSFGGQCFPLKITFNIFVSSTRQPCYGCELHYFQFPTIMFSIKIQSTLPSMEFLK